MPHAGGRQCVGGKKAKRKTVKMGTMCTFTYLGPDSEAKKIDCKS